MTNSQAEHQTDRRKRKTYLKGICRNYRKCFGIFFSKKTKLAEIAVPLKADAKGNITAKITDAKAAGVVGEDESAMNGTVTMGTSSANVFVPNYDVNSNGTVDIIDITRRKDTIR